LLRPRHGFHAFPIPLLEPRAKEEGENPPRVQSDWDEATGPVGNARRATPAPQSKPVTHASRLVTHNAPSVAFELGRRIRPQGQLTYDCTPIRGACVPGPQKVCSDSSP